MQRRHLSSTPASDSRASRLPQVQRQAAPSVRSTAGCDTAVGSGASAAVAQRVLGGAVDRIGTWLTARGRGVKMKIEIKIGRNLPGP